MYTCMIAQGFHGKQNKKKKTKPWNGRTAIHEYLTYKLILGVPDENISFSNDL